jgi:hypothetical protein
MVSAKYAWRQGGPRQDKKYFFAVRSAHGLTSYGPVVLVATGGTLDSFAEVQPGAVPPVEGPFEVAIVTERVTPEGAIVDDEYDQVSEFIRCAEK